MISSGLVRILEVSLQADEFRGFAWISGDYKSSFTTLTPSRLPRTTPLGWCSATSRVFSIGSPAVSSS